MRYEGTTFRPPPEADSFLLQVTVGCAHNRCAFCSMYRDVKFRKIEMGQIEADLVEARGIFPHMERIFLVNGDAFVLPADDLEKIAGRIKVHFPECRTITMYASIRNIKTKTDAQLKRLAELGINDLYVGVESGWDEVLAHVNKGHTVAEAKKQLQRLAQAGIRHRDSLVLGLAGAGKGVQNGRHTAAFLNETKSNLIWVGTLAAFPDCELYEEIQAGKFTMATEREILEEERELINNINLENVIFYGNHPTNSLSLMGMLPRDKVKFVEAIDHYLGHCRGDKIPMAPARANM